MGGDEQTFSVTGDISTNVSERVAMARHFSSIGQMPFFQEISSVNPPHVGVRGRQCVLLGSNSYIGLSTHPDVIAAAVRATEEFGTGTTGSRLLNGTYSLHVALEKKIADWLGHDDAVVFTTGYQTNVGTIQGLIGSDCLAVVDSYAHASIRDGVRLSRAVEERFDHNDVASSKPTVLQRHSGTRFRRSPGPRPLADSMEGSTACSADRSSTCARAEGAMLMVDEAHGIGVFWIRPAPNVELTGAAQDIDAPMAFTVEVIGGLGGFRRGLARHRRRDPVQRAPPLVQYVRELRQRWPLSCPRRPRDPRRRGSRTPKALGADRRPTRGAFGRSTSNVT